MLSNITDLHLKADSLEGSLSFPGPAPLSERLREFAKEMLARCNAFRKDDFMLSLDGTFWRGRRDSQAVDGIWYRLRRMPSDPPSLSNLPSPLPSQVKAMLMSQKLRNGGLIYICGAPGNGKTTTASGSVVSRLREYGGFAYTIEDPPEMPLNGWHNDGYCTQTWVAGDTGADWHESFRGVLRSQPAGTSLILYVGEVRDRESAQALIRAASNGFLVIATGFGTDIITGLDSLIKLAGEDSISSLAGLIRVVLHQRITSDAIIVSALASQGPSTMVAARIRSRQLSHLINDIQFQANRMRLGSNPLEEDI